jgi:hypothetical protein
MVFIGVAIVSGLASSCMQFSATKALQGYIVASRFECREPGSHRGTAWLSVVSVFGQAANPSSVSQLQFRPAFFHQPQITVVFR